MNLKIVKSNSSGNAYALISNNGETLLIEAGVPLKKVKEALNFNMDNICGCIISHIHHDHAGYVNEYIDNGIDIYCSQDTYYALKENPKIKSNSIGQFYPIDPFVEETIGKTPLEVDLVGFRIIPFNLFHDVPNYGYIINHPECGNIVFITDTFCINETFENVNHWMLECNHDRNILHENLESGIISKKQFDRVIQSHLEIDVTKAILNNNDLSQTKNIILIHLSEKNSNAPQFKKEIEESTKKQVFIATPNLEIMLNS